MSPTLSFIIPVYGTHLLGYLEGSLQRTTLCWSVLIEMGNFLQMVMVYHSWYRKESGLSQAQPCRSRKRTSKRKPVFDLKTLISIAVIGFWTQTLKTQSWVLKRCLAHKNMPGPKMTQRLGAKRKVYCVGWIFCILFSVVSFFHFFFFFFFFFFWYTFSKGLVICFSLASAM